MVQTESTSHTDHVPGATAVRVLGALLIVQGGFRVYGTINTAINTVVLVSQRGIDPSRLLLFLFLSGVIGLLTTVAGVLLVRLDRAGRGFGLVICSIALAHQVLTFATTLVALKVVTSSATSSLGLLFWLLPAVYIVLFLVGIILIVRWHPPRLPS